MTVILSVALLLGTAGFVLAVPLGLCELGMLFTGLSLGLVGVVLLRRIK